MEKTIYEQAIEMFGVEKQTDMLIEEMAELTQALLKNRRDPLNEAKEQNIYEEIADVEIVLAQIKSVLRWQYLLDEYKKHKLSKLESLINKP